MAASRRNVTTTRVSFFNTDQTGADRESEWSLERSASIIENLPPGSN